MHTTQDSSERLIHRLLTITKCIPSLFEKLGLQEYIREQQCYKHYNFGYTDIAVFNSRKMSCHAVHAAV